MATTPDLSALSTAFVQYGGKALMKQVNEFELSKHGILVMKNVKKPMALPKFAATGTPRPYREQDDTTSNGVAVTDRILTVYQSKWDFDVDPEKYRNTYLNDGTENPFYQVVLQQVAKEYLAHINDSTVYLGVYNASGTTPAAIATGYGTILAAEITATNITPITTGAITSANAVTKVELVARAVPAHMKSKGFITYVSYDVFDKYTQHYRTLNGFQFQPGSTGDYKLDNINSVLRPVSWMGTSQRIICTPANNLVMGVDGESVSVSASVRRNIIEVRPMMPVGFQIADLEVVYCNEQA